MKPILFNTENVRAILDGRKTVTRRAVKFPRGWNPKFTGYIPDGAVLYGSNNIPAAKAPYRTGDILWVRETFRKFRVKHPGKAVPDDYHEIQYEYKADGDLRNSDGALVKWRPNIHMPREAARIFLRVTMVRVERLREIGFDGVVCEGLDPTADDFSGLWNRTIKPADLHAYGWEANPWVWVIEFERISKEEAERDAR